MDARECQTRTVLHRRGVLQLAVATASATLLAACGEATAPTAPASPPPNPAIPATVAATLPAQKTTGVVSTVAPTAPAPTAARTVAPAIAPTIATPALTTAPTAASPTTRNTVDGLIPSPAPGVPDAWTKLPPATKSVAATPGHGSKVTIFQYNNLTPLPPKTENRYLQEFEKRLGVTLEIDLVPQAAYPEKIEALTASGNLADLMYVDLNLVPGQARTIVQGAYTDLTPFLTGDGLKEFPNLAQFPPQAWKNVAINGKIYGVPRPRWQAASPLMFRSDWAEKFGGLPKNADQFFDLMVKFTKGDPDGNGKDDTYGMTSKLNGAGIFNHDWISSMFRVPNEWRLNTDGTLTKDIETEEFRAAITYQKRLWDAGVFHPDAATHSTNQAKDLFLTGKVGGYFDSVTAIGGMNGLRGRLRQLNANGKMVGLVPPGYDGGAPITHNGFGYFGFIAVPAKVGRDRERAKELLQILNYYTAPFGSEEYLFLQYGLEGIHHTVQPDGTRVVTDLGKRDISDIPNLTNAPQVAYYPGAPGDAEYIQGLVRDMQAVGADNPALTAFSPTLAAKGGELAQLKVDRLTAIITGREPPSALDGYVKDWRSRGGDQIRKELQDALKSR